MVGGTKKDPFVCWCADARRNRDKIITAAMVAFGDDGPYLPMEETARRAGVGTLYRHFPDRDALIVAVVRDSLETMLARAREIDSLVSAAQQEGSLRPDVGTGDVIHLFWLLLRGLQEMPGALADAAYDRARAVILDGLRARSDASLPGRALTARDLDPR
ncbi:helix-turn-helix domain-containing protein [Frankia sp. EAN1pec]|uniref:SbtR family transcriptional regulator n=1 Tax=Parafrankia sp. (strain EAN1pec) TaxID=298653 RepID=UPI0006748B9E